MPVYGLSGDLPVQLGHLDAIRSLEIGGNALTGRLPASLAALPLREFSYAGTGLCAPADASFRAWLNTVSVHEGTGVECAPATDRDILAILYHATGGPNWRTRRNWLTDAPLGEWHGVEVAAEGRIVSLILADNNLAGAIPPELGQLAHLERLQLLGNPPIPPELGSVPLGEPGLRPSQPGPGYPDAGHRDGSAQAGALRGLSLNGRCDAAQIRRPRRRTTCG